MISPPSSPTLSAFRSKHHTENDSPPLSPKRSIAQLEEDPLSQPELKRREVQSSKRAPLDSLSASDLENRRFRGSQSTDRASHHTLVEPASVLDLVLYAGQSVSSASCGMQRSGVPDALVCSWPPSIPTAGAIRSSHSSFALHSPDEKSPSRATFLEPTSTAWNAPEPFQAEPTPTAGTRPSRASGWKSENVLQPIRSRTTSMPSVRRPPGDLWRSESSPIDADRQLVDPADLATYPTPPGLPPRRSALTRRDSSPDLLSHCSVSLSLAHGSQPLSASEHTKAVPPIGAERNHATSITSPKSHTRNFSPAQSHDLSWRSPSLSPKLRARNETDSLNAAPPENVQSATGNSREDLERLLRRACRNKYAPKVVTPFNPLRTSPSAPDLSANPAYQSRMPSQWNIPSPRYSQCLPRRTRTICDGHQTLDWNATCMHCPECKRDSVGKRLLAFRYRQQQQAHRSQRNKLAYPLRVSTTPIMDDDRLALTNRREVSAYELDEEEKSLWEEIAAVTGAEPLSFPHVGAPCAIAAYRRLMDDGIDDEARDDYLEISGEGLLVNESATRFQVSVY